MTTGRNLLSAVVTGQLESDNGAGEVWTELLKKAKAPGIVNLGQGYPDYAGSSVARAAAASVLTDPSLSHLNQYSLPGGLDDLRAAVCSYYNKDLSTRGASARTLAPENVVITAGATEALYIAMRALAGPGDEVITFDPGFPWYAPVIRLCGAKPVLLELKPPRFAPDLDAVERAITPATRALLLNTPHNPCGHCLTMAELEGFAALAEKHDLAVISDEVYENVCFADAEHLRIADVEGMFDRTVTLCSASKLFSLTGWRVGWALGPPSLIRGLGSLHTATTYCAPSPLQHGVATALAAEQGDFEGVPAAIEANAKLLTAALTEKGFGVCLPNGGHFLVANTTPLGMGGLACAQLLLEKAKVAAIPGGVFYASTPQGGDRPLLRFAICKQKATIEEAAKRIAACDLRK